MSGFTALDDSWGLGLRISQELWNVRARVVATSAYMVSQLESSSVRSLAAGLALDEGLFTAVSRREVPCDVRAARRVLRQLRTKLDTQYLDTVMSHQMHVVTHALGFRFAAVCMRSDILPAGLLTNVAGGSHDAWWPAALLQYGFWHYGQ